jgi:hypothetical protein
VGLGYDVVVVLDVCELLPNAAAEVWLCCIVLLHCSERHTLPLGQSKIIVRVEKEYSRMLIDSQENGWDNEAAVR